MSHVCIAKQILLAALCAMYPPIVIHWGARGWNGRVKGRRKRERRRVGAEIRKHLGDDTGWQTKSAACSAAHTTTFNGNDNAHSAALAA